ncbi:MAG: ligase-associated DNA damage response endonuclease PdeM [Rhodospirillales bacterium]|nr:ligase-associated DNA damage response endonuclease PdeM [Rhodospirillales bacterium]
MSQARFSFRGMEVVACPSGGLYIPAFGTLAAADLHLEKGSACARRGRLLPPYDSRATLAALADAIARFQPSRVVCLGDSFHDKGGTDRLDDAAVGFLRQLAASRDWVWIAGNHDPAPHGLGGRCTGELRVGPFVFRHAAREDTEPGEISGHFHPKATVATAGRRFTGRCFAGNGRRLILPAFGAYAGGLDVFAPALSALLAVDFTVHLIGRSRVHAFPAAGLVGAKPGF